MAELLVLFKDAQDSRGPWPHHQSFRRASLRSPSSKTGDAAKGIPVLLTTELLLFCSPRDSDSFSFLVLALDAFAQTKKLMSLLSECGIASNEYLDGNA
jgi:hypothetical protein